MKTDVTLSRREVIVLGGALGLAAGMPGLITPALGLAADPKEKRYDAVIQIHLVGAPSQLDTFDPKPGSTSNVYPTIDLGFRDVDNKVVRVTNFLRQIAAAVGDGKGDVRLASLRGVHHGTGVHTVAQTMMSSFWSSPVGAIYPPAPVILNHFLKSAPGALGIPSVVLADPVLDGSNDAKGTALAPALEVVAEADPASAMRLPTGVDAARATRRRDLVNLISSAFSGSRPDTSIKAWDAATARAHTVAVQGAAAKAFDLRGKALVPGTQMNVRRRLTLARELVMAGVPYVALGSASHDTHTNMKARLTTLWTDQLDPGIAGLVKDLAASGKRVLITIGGEFGRTPDSVKPVGGVRRDGRDHWPEAFSWGLLSINQPDFVSTAIGDTGPDGLFKGADLIDPTSPSAIGGLVYRCLGFPLTTETRIRLADGRLVQPVDQFQATQDFESTVRSTPMTTPRLMRRLFKSIV